MRQRGLATWGQLRRRGMNGHAITRAAVAGRLHEVHPGVYSVVPPELMTRDARYAAAVLAGGRGSCLCHASAGWWVKVVEEEPDVIHVAVIGPREPIEGIRWHRLKLADDERVKIDRMPVTAPVRIPLDIAADVTPRELKRVLAELEFHHGVGPELVATTLRRGYRGSAKLRRALATHIPQLAETREELEREFAFFLAERGFQQPEFNHPVGRSTVDAIYRDARLVFELDGVKGHSGERRILRDHRRDLHRRADGLIPIRYAYAQLTTPADQLLIEEELERLGVPRVGPSLSHQPR